MINILEFKSLEELASEDCHILLDASIMNPLGKSRKDICFGKTKEKADFTEENNKFIHEIGDIIINNSHFLTTNLVIEELSNTKHYNYKKMIKLDGQCGDKELLRLRRFISEEEKSRRRVVNAFIENNQVVSLKDEMKCMYDRMFKEYKRFMGEYNLNLSYKDLDFLLTGITLALLDKPMIFLSNDYKIFYARNKILGKESLEEQKVRFFTRVDFFKFKLLTYHKHPQIKQLSGGS